MIFLYNAGIWLYNIIIISASLFNPKARLWLKGRKNIFKKISSEIVSSDKIAWFHCASLGEFEQGRPVLEKFRNIHKDFKILLTFFSPSGYEVKKNYEFADYIYYLPMDTSYNAKKFIQLTHPSIVFFVKYEFWYNYLNILSKKKIPVIVFSAIFRKNQHFFKWYAQWFRNALRKLTLITVQNEESLMLLKKIKVENIVLTGDTRFDRVFEICNNTKSFPLVERFKQNKMTFIAGSTWADDESFICNYINENPYKLKYIIAPHIVSKDRIDHLREKLSVTSLKFSELTNDNAEKAIVLIIDGIGFLSHLYAYASIAYIGGGFNRGIHNTLEAATFGLPVLFGPNYHKFKEAKDLIRLRTAFEINNQEDFNKNMNYLVSNPDFLYNCAEVSKNYVKINTGATNKILENLLRLSF